MLQTLPDLVAAVGLSGLAGVYGFGMGKYGWPPISWIRRRRRADMDESYQAARLRQFQQSQVGPKIVFAGDSLIEWGLWSELFPGSDILNRGVAGGTATELLARSDEFLGRSPKQVVVMVGVNDLIAGSRPDDVAAAIFAVGKKVIGSGASLVLHEIVFPGPAFARITNAVQAVNLRVRDWARANGVPCLNLNGALAPDGLLDKAFRWDGLHLNAPAYAIWQHQLSPLLIRTAVDQSNGATAA